MRNTFFDQNTSSIKDYHSQYSVMCKIVYSDSMRNDQVCCIKLQQHALSVRRDREEWHRYIDNCQRQLFNA